MIRYSSNEFYDDRLTVGVIDLTQLSPNEEEDEEEEIYYCKVCDRRMLHCKHDNNDLSNGPLYKKGQYICPKCGRVEGNDSSVMLLKLTSKFLVILYQAKSPRINTETRMSDSNITELKEDTGLALNHWLKHKSGLGRQYEFAVQAVQNQIDLAVDILSKCFIDMYREVQRESLSGRNKK